MEKSQSFVSVVTLIDLARIHSLDTVPALQQYLDEGYCDYEILLIVKKNVQAALARKMERLLKEVPAIRYLQLANNAPDDVALSAGLENAIGDFIVFCDLQTDPLDCIGKAIEQSKSGSDVVIGISKGNESLAYAVARPLAGWLLRSADYRLPRNASAFRCLSRRAANSVMSTQQFHQQFFMRIQKSGYEFSEMPYEYMRAPHKTLSQGIHETLRLMVFNSSAPLRTMTMLGLGGSAIAFLFSLYAVVLKFVRDDVMSGWASTVVMISFFALLQFVILAFISEYLGRLLIEQSHAHGYSVVYEKNSLVMINQDRINVLESSINADRNLVQTGRNK